MGGAGGKRSKQRGRVRSPSLPPSLRSPFSLLLPADTASHLLRGSQDRKTPLMLAEEHNTEFAARIRGLSS